MDDKSVPANGGILGRLVPARYLLAALGSTGLAIVYGLKVNLSVAMVVMLNHTALGHNGPPDPDHHDESTCRVEENTSSVEDGPFVWSEPLQGAILSCYFWGYFASQLPGGRIAEVASAKWVMFFSVAINVACTLLTPIMADFHYLAVIAMRIAEGIGGGVTFPAMHVLLSRWSPPAERSVLSSTVYAGTSLGTVVSMLLAGALASWWGWRAVFYVMGALSIIWCALWAWLVQDTPQKQKYISQEERDMIEESLAGAGCGEKAPVPWRALFTSKPFIAIVIAHTCSNWGWYTLLIELPFYMKQVLHFNIKENALATSLPFLTMWLFSMILSKCLDTLRAKGTLSTTSARKIATLIASCVPLCCLLSLGYIGCRRGLAVALMALAITCKGAMFSGFLANHIDLAPNYAGTLMAVTNTLATIPGILVPIVVGQLTHGNQTVSAWSSVFRVASGLYVVEIALYSLWGSGEQQSWARGDCAEAVPLRSQETEAKYDGQHNEEPADE